jgi:hypothetical protein
LKPIKVRGSCLCGAVRYEIAGPIGGPENCHCGMCRKAHGSAFSTNALVPTDALRVIAGAERLTEYESSTNRRKCFCRECGSQLFIRRLNRPEFTVVTLGTLDDDPGVRPTRHVFAGSKAPWHEIDGPLPTFKIYPGYEEAADPE